MLFYKLKGTLKTDVFNEISRHERRDEAHRIGLEIETFNEKHKKTDYIFISEISDTTTTIGIITHSTNNTRELFKSFTESINLPMIPNCCEEITLRMLKGLLENAAKEGFIENTFDVLYNFKLNNIDGRRIPYGENLIERKTQSQILELSSNYYMNDTLLPELERIYMGKSKSAAEGHPVHYMIETNDKDTRRNVYSLLLSALYNNNRIHNRRYTFLDANASSDFPEVNYDAIYAASDGGAVIVRYDSNEENNEFDFADNSLEVIELICKTALNHRNKVLTIFCIPHDCKKIKNYFYEALGSLSLIEIREDLINTENATLYLKKMSSENHVRSDKKLFESLEEGSYYLAPELKSIFDKWYNNKLKTTIYPQYKDLSTVETTTRKARALGSAYDVLNEMIGLTEAKSVIDKALKYYKMQAIYRERGVKNDRVAMHMIFSGNPGTAKTTVARLFARIMKENGLLSSGHLVEVGRGDLIGKYVGWTAQNVKAKFKQAQGGVLFIDEAYSLVDDRDGSFGDEAINTIVQEMENNRDDIVVIFAGYPDKMEGFLGKNPGLRSRIAFHIPFADYDSVELCEIARLISKNHGMKISDGAIDKLERIFDEAREDTDFGNGRYVRNIFEQSRMNQAARLMELDIENISDDEILTITEDDIIITKPSYKSEKKRIGFC